MSATVIKVENLSKLYQLGVVGSGTLGDDLARIWAQLRGKEDPTQKIGSERKANNEDFWALRDINFEVKQGEAVGIVGKNGAGKSTLLKILSRTTVPTLGTVRVRGRIASLLEVGTGFHPDLTGRENIYMNGAILGMRKVEIRARLDEIINFSGVEKYIDTPVKRYSSGMYVRLAFAVAAHLEPDILIVDEVLAVGDAEFQKKCLGKMNDASHKEGRTVLFVSHSIAAIENLCDKCILLRGGEVDMIGNTESVMDRYTTPTTTDNFTGTITIPDDDLNIIAIREISFSDECGKVTSSLKTWDNVKICFTVFSPTYFKNGSVFIRFFTMQGCKLFEFSTMPLSTCKIDFDAGINKVYLEIPNFPMSAGDFLISAGIAIPWKDYLCNHENLGPIRVNSRDVYDSNFSPQAIYTNFAFKHSWSFNNKL